MGKSHVPSALQVTLAVVALPVSSTKPRGVDLLARLALFQLAFATTPAVSLAAMAVPLPTKSMLMDLATPLPALVTFSVTLVECVSAPLAPVMVSAAEPVGVLAVVVMVSTELPLPLSELGLNVAVAPVGKPLALKVTALLNPFRAATVAL